MSDWILSVSSLNEYVSQLFAEDSLLDSLRLRGEVSNFKAYPSGHWYFTLKDDRCRISCVMFRANALRMSFRPHEGDQVILHGCVRLYEEGGSYQFVADSMRPEGVGSLYRQFERLKEKLREEGLFDEARKRSLPVRPRKIAIVTSEAGAVLHDIRQVSARRDASIPLVLLPVQVQGEGAAAQIAWAIRKAGTLPMVDVIITGRGGGSLEDLWAFNEECVARAIADSPVPVISAVGHETDFTIADFVADVRASTPSNAAEMAVPDRSEVAAALRSIRRRLDAAVDAAVSSRELSLQRTAQRMAHLSPREQVQAMQSRATELRHRLDRAADRQTGSYAPRIAMVQIRIEHAIDGMMEQLRQQMKRDRAQLEAISPVAVMKRGYAIVRGNGHVLTSASQAQAHMTLHFHDGTVNVALEED